MALNLVSFEFGSPRTCIHECLSTSCVHLNNVSINTVSQCYHENKTYCHNDVLLQTGFQHLQLVPPRAISWRAGVVSSIQCPSDGLVAGLVHGVHGTEKQARGREEASVMKGSSESTSLFAMWGDTVAASDLSRSFIVAFVNLQLDGFLSDNLLSE